MVGCGTQPPFLGYSYEARSDEYEGTNRDNSRIISAFLRNYGVVTSDSPLLQKDDKICFKFK